jgi:hypothetical protein
MAVSRSRHEEILLQNGLNIPLIGAVIHAYDFSRVVAISEILPRAVELLL